MKSFPIVKLFVNEYGVPPDGLTPTAIQNAIIKVGDPMYIYRYAIDVFYADRKLLQDAISQNTDPLNAYYIYLFAIGVPTADQELLADAIRKTNVAYYIKQAIKNFKISKTLKQKLERQLVLAQLSENP